MGDITLIIAKDFSSTTGPRYRTEGTFSGQEFREDFLLPKLQEAIDEGCILTVVLDGAEGYGTSFLEESFGGLIRNNALSKSLLDKHLSIISNEEPYLIEDINEYVNDADEEAKKNGIMFCGLLLVCL